MSKRGKTRQVKVKVLSKQYAFSQPYFLLLLLSIRTICIVVVSK